MKFYAFTLILTVLARVSPVYGQAVQDEAFCAKACSCPCNQNSGGAGFQETIMKYLDCNIPSMLSMFGVMDKKQANQAVELCKIVSHEAKVIQQDIETKDSITKGTYEIPDSFSTNKTFGKISQRDWMWLQKDLTFIVKKLEKP